MLNINQIKVDESQKVVLLGLTIDNRLTNSGKNKAAIRRICK